MSTYTFNESMALFKRAAHVIPCGIYGHMTPSITVPGSFPYYAAKGRGCRYWDVDGNEFIDYICAYGPMVVGYNNPRVEEAARKQMEEGNCLNHPGGIMVELAEYLVDLIPMGDWAVFAKNGSDLTTWALQVAREFTKRSKIAMVKGTYHGAHAWCTPGHGGLIEEDRSRILKFQWNDADSLRDLVQANKGEIAGVIMTPFHHPAFGDCEMPKDGFWGDIRSICDEDGILLILDDVRAGFRLHMGGSNEYFGFRPDLTVFCKAIANGYPISAALGREELKSAAANVFLTGSYWNSAVPMAAARATLEELKETDGIAQMAAMGTRLMKGLEEGAREQGMEVVCSGPPSIPFMRFADESDFMRQQVFCAETSKRGVFFHPHHNWFLSAAHTEADIDESLDVAAQAFRIVKEKFGS